MYTTPAGDSATITMPTALVTSAAISTFLRPSRSASRPVETTDAAMASVWMLAASATSPPAILRSRTTLTSAVLDRKGALPCTAANTPRNGMAKRYEWAGGAADPGAGTSPDGGLWAGIPDTIDGIYQ